MLEDPYWGPNVTNGTPKVYMRTNLLPGSNSNTNSNTNSKNEVLSIDTDEAVTCLLAHPELPYVICGKHHGGISIFGSDRGKGLDNEAASESAMSSV